MDKPEQNIIWTVLPNGVEGKKLRFSVFVSPQLKNPPGGNPVQPLATYQDFLDWPKTVSDQITFTLTFDGLTPIPEKIGGIKYKRVDPPPLQDRSLNPWKEVFATTLSAKLRPVVRSYNAHETDLPDLDIVTFSTSGVMIAVEKWYKEGCKKIFKASLQEPATFDEDAHAYAGLPSSPASNNLSESLRAYLQEEYGEAFKDGTLSEKLSLAINSRLEELSNNPSAPQLTKPPPGISENVWNLGLANFYRDMLTRKPDDNTAFAGGELAHKQRANRDQPQELEFHDTVAALSSLPLLMRQLWLVIDFKLEMTAGAGAIPRQGKLKIEPKWKKDSEDVTRRDISPWTAYQFGGTVFQADRKDANSEILNGFLPIGPPLFGPAKYHLEQRDALAEAVKLVGQISLANRNEECHLTPPRGGSIALIQRDLSDDLKSKLSASQKGLKDLYATSGADAPLHADDLIRGYRMDVKRKGVWRSLCSREGEYRFLNSGSVEELQANPPDEGWIAKSAARVGTGESLPDRLAVHDIVCKWEGWSHAAPRPSGTIVSEKVTEKDEDEVDEKRKGTYKVIFTAAKNSLPSLRFGEQYQVRVRLVDLAGNSRPLNDPFGDDHAVVSKPIEFLRYETIASPDVVPRTDLSSAPGESALTLVIRSNYNRRCTEVAERHIAPPKTSELMAEMHAMFDKHFRVDRSFYKKINDHDNDAPQIVPDLKYEIPYLSDPIATSALLRDVPGATKTVTPLEFALGPGEWPDVRTWRLQLMEDPNAQIPADDVPPQFKAPLKPPGDNSTFTIFLPKAVIVSIPLCSGINETDLEKMALWAEVRDEVVGAPEFKKHILAGENPLFTPVKTLKLVHAVQQPLFEPRFKGDKDNKLKDAECIKVKREVGSTSAILTADMRMPGLSAESYQVSGTWKEIRDDGKNRKEVTVSAVAFGDSLTPSDQNLKVVGQHEFNDTKHREITYQVSAKTRFEKYLKIGPGDSLTRESRLVRGIHIPNSSVPPAPDVLYVVPTFGWESLGTTPEDVRRRRRGGGLRVYLKHRWYETGTDELLGVRVATDSDNVEEDDLWVSRWGRDPISQLGGPNTILKQTDLKGDFVEDKIMSFKEGKRSVTIVGYPVEYDEVRGLWFCDLEVDPGKAYFPFIRLALTRFQPYSIGMSDEQKLNLFISPTVVTDFCQLAPERTVSFVRNFIGIPEIIRNLRVDGKAIVRSSEVTVVLEIVRQNMDGEIRWEKGSEPVKLEFRSDSSGAYWALDAFSTAPDPTPDPNVNQKLKRLVIKEYEAQTDDTSDGAGGGIVRRLIYADTVEL